MRVAVGAARAMPLGAVLLLLLPAAACAYVTVVESGHAYVHRSAAFGPLIPEEGVWGTAVSLRSISYGNEL